jgi:hypothetical protein
MLSSLIILEITTAVSLNVKSQAGLPGNQMQIKIPECAVGVN